MILMVSTLSRMGNRGCRSLLRRVKNCTCRRPRVGVILSYHDGFHERHRLRLFARLFLRRLDVSSTESCTTGHRIGDSEFVEDIFTGRLRSFVGGPFFLDMLVSTCGKGKGRLPGAGTSVCGLFVGDDCSGRMGRGGMSLSTRRDFRRSIQLLREMTLKLSLVGTRDLGGRRLHVYLRGSSGGIRRYLQCSLVHSRKNRCSFTRGTFHR